MNILPKKRWHVRTKQNIDRVRRDEAKAAEEEKERQRKIQLANQEARTDFLRQRVRQARGSDDNAAVVDDEGDGGDKPSSHVNLFKELDDGKKSWGTNKEHEAEERAEKEKFEQSIGLLTYLGQGSEPQSAEKPWYFKAPEKRKYSSDDKKEEATLKSKSFLDPLQDLKKYLGPDHFENSDTKHKKQKIEEKPKKKHKDKSKLTSSGQSLDELRAERLKREREERYRTEKLLAKMRGETPVEPTNQIDGQQGYNSQFNPHLARQSKKI